MLSSSPSSSLSSSSRFRFDWPKSPAARSALARSVVEMRSFAAAASASAVKASRGSRSAAAASLARAAASANWGFDGSRVAAIASDTDASRTFPSAK